MNLQDDNEFARYLAQYLYDNYDSEVMDREALELLIKRFLENQF